MKAFILAAGLGERLRPLTEKTPKPLLLLAGKPLIVHTILRCKKAGITDFVINVCYLGDQIKSVLQDGSEWGVHIQYSEEEKPLGMAGGTIHALHLLGEKPFIMTSSDVVTDYDFSVLVKKAPQVSHAHLVMVDKQPFNPKGDFHLSSDGIIDINEDPKLNYAGFGVFHPDIFKKLPDEFMNMITLMKPYLLAHQVSGEYFRGEWFDLITIADYHALCARMATPS